MSPVKQLELYLIGSRGLLSFLALHFIAFSNLEGKQYAVVHNLLKMYFYFLNMGVKELQKEKVRSNSKRQFWDSCS